MPSAKFNIILKSQRSINAGTFRHPGFIWHLKHVPDLIVERYWLGKWNKLFPKPLEHLEGHHQQTERTTVTFPRIGCLFKNNEKTRRDLLLVFKSCRNICYVQMLVQQCSHGFVHKVLLWDSKFRSMPFLM